MLVYTQRAELNNEFFMLKHVMGLNEPFNFLVFINKKEEEDDQQDEQWEGLLQEIRHIHNSNTNDLNGKIDKNHLELIT